MKQEFAKVKENHPPLIAIYDSGVGGLLVLREFLHKMPHASYVYYADSANMPYGNKTSDEILTWTKNILSWMSREFQPDFLVSACNTSSSVLAVSEYNEYAGVLYSPLDVLQADSVKKFKNIIVACTQATADSKIHEKLLAKTSPTTYVKTLGFTRLAYLIENDSSLAEIEQEISHTLDSLDQSIDWDAIICGCTHYSVVKDVFFNYFQKNMPQKVLPFFIDPAKSMALNIEQQSLLNDFDQIGEQKMRFYSNDTSQLLFDQKIQKYLKRNVESLYHNPHKDL